jgi:hypothetical protein
VPENPQGHSVSAWTPSPTPHPRRLARSGAQAGNSSRADGPGGVPPDLSGCVAASVPATGLSLRSPWAAIDLSWSASMPVVPASPAPSVPAGKHLGCLGRPACVPFLRGAWS